MLTGEPWSSSGFDSGGRRRRPKEGFCLWLISSEIEVWDVLVVIKRGSWYEGFEKGVLVMAELTERSRWPISSEVKKTTTSRSIGCSL